MTYDKLLEVYKNQFAIEGLQYADIDKLFNLVGTLWLAAKKKDDNVTPYTVLTKILKTKTLDPVTEEFIEVPWTDMDGFTIPFSIQLEYNVKYNSFVPSTLGLKTAKEIIDAINKIMEEWLPF